MRLTLFGRLAVVLALTSVGTVSAAGRYLEVSYPPSTKPDELQLGVSYTLWIPDPVAKIRGIIVHQHGCGPGACKGGATAAYDLHWQALAKKWDCALLGPSYQQEDKQNCRLWCDPRNGSHKTFLKAIGEFAVKANHPELEKAPWCLWGHSGGGFWASLMQTMYPERIVAIWFRSGTALAAWEKGEIPTPEIPEAAYSIPMMCNPGAKEEEHERFNRAWTGCMAMFKAFVIQRDGSELARLPEKPVGRFGRPLFQQMSYHDTPEKPLREMRFMDAAATAATRHEYRVMSVNSVGLQSEPSNPCSVP
ncbi:MAG: hypothetical protein ABIP48_18545 [Planctomycetota bacterium]